MSSRPVGCSGTQQTSVPSLRINSFYNRTHERHRVRCTILEIERLEHGSLGRVAAIPHPSLCGVPQSCSCLRKTTPFSALALEKLPLVGSHPTSVFSSGALCRRYLPRVWPERLPRPVNRKSGMRLDGFALNNSRGVLGLSNEGLSMVRI